MIVGLGLAGVSQATVPRAFVSVNGSDANPCSAVQPCRSFNQALTVVEAGGEIVVQDSGGYSTGFTITHSVTIDAAGFNASVISTTTSDLCTINTGTTDRVVLRGISFHGANIGNDAIHVARVGSLYVEHCSIAEFANEGVAMVNGGNLWVTDTDIRACTAVGVAVETSSSLAPANLFGHDSRLTECGTGVFLAANNGGRATGLLRNCSAALGGDGFLVGSNSSGNASLALTNCRAVGNANGLFAQLSGTGNATIRISNCVVTGNTTGISTAASGGGTALVLGTGAGTNVISGNRTNGAVSSIDFLQ
jgi:hypothetical protein